MKKDFQKKITFILVALVVFLGIIQLVLSGNVSAASVEVGSLERQAAILEKDNKLLEEKIARGSSLLEIQKKASRLGFDKPCVLVDYSSGESVALKK
jgi:hypothetical protein